MTKADKMMPMIGDYIKSHQNELSLQIHSLLMYRNWIGRPKLQIADLRFKIWITDLRIRDLRFEIIDWQIADYKLLIILYTAKQPKGYSLYRRSRLPSCSF